MLKYFIVSFRFSLPEKHLCAYIYRNLSAYLLFRMGTCGCVYVCIYTCVYIHVYFVLRLKFYFFPYCFILYIFFYHLIKIIIIIIIVTIIINTILFKPIYVVEIYLAG